MAIGRLDTRRDLTFVGDTVDGFVRAMTAPGLEGRVVQLGTGRAESIGDLFAMACRVVGVEAQPKLEERRLRPDPSEVMVLQSDASLAKALLGWQAKVDLEEGLLRTVYWYRRQMDGAQGAAS